LGGASGLIVRKGRSSQQKKVREKKNIYTFEKTRETVSQKFTRYASGRKAFVTAKKVRRRKKGKTLKARKLTIKQNTHLYE